MWESRLTGISLNFTFPLLQHPDDIILCKCSWSRTIRTFWGVALCLWFFWFVCLFCWDFLLNSCTTYPGFRYFNYIQKCGRNISALIRTWSLIKTNWTFNIPAVIILCCLAVWKDERHGSMVSFKLLWGLYQSKSDNS